jgi:glucuronoarabinoxylan endo-1,4-beta-xylanase
MGLRRTIQFATLFVSFLALPPGGRAQAQTVSINWATTYQVIDGFGASDAYEAKPLTPAQADLLFSPTAGMGLSLLRTAVPDDGSCATVNATCAGEVVDMQLAIARGAKVWSTPWSPPANMKSNGNVDNGGVLLESSYSAYAEYLANYVSSLQTLYGINLYALSVQNEPDITATYDSATWTAANLDSFIASNLGPTLAAKNLSPRLIIAEPSGWQMLPNFANASMNDTAAEPYLSITGAHDYQGTAATTYATGQAKGKRLWQTEVCDTHTPFDPSIASALHYAQYINDWMTTANANAWHYWRLVGRWTASNNEALISTSGVVTKRLYMMGNYSKFVRPGSYRLAATAAPQAGVSVSAYKNSATAALVIVVINQNAQNVSQAFTLNGATVSSVTPWITSASLDLAVQPSVPVTGGSFTYTLPGQSITSFVTTAGALAPAGLTAKSQ